MCREKQTCYFVSVSLFDGRLSTKFTIRSLPLAAAAASAASADIMM